MTGLGVSSGLLGKVLISVGQGMSDMGKREDAERKDYEGEENSKPTPEELAEKVPDEI